MTRQQIADCLGYHISYVTKAFQDAIKEHPELNHYNPANNKKDCGIDYTLQECLLAMSYFYDGRGISKVEQNFLIDDFTMRESKKTKAIGIKGTEEFLEKVAAYPKKKCCSTCAYCIKSTMRNRKPVLKPYCNLWNRFLHRLKADPYNDHCRQWEYSGKEPLIFYTAESPTNLDVYGNERNEVMGFDSKCFGKESDGSFGLVTDIGLQESSLL